MTNVSRNVQLDNTPWCLMTINYNTNLKFVEEPGETKLHVGKTVLCSDEELASHRECLCLEVLHLLRRQRVQTVFESEGGLHFPAIYRWLSMVVWQAYFRWPVCLRSLCFILFGTAGIAKSEVLQFRPQLGPDRVLRAQNMRTIVNNETTLEHRSIKGESTLEWTRGVGGVGHMESDGWAGRSCPARWTRQSVE